MENTNSNDQNKIKKLIQNAKIDKKSQKILKCLSTTSLVDIIQIHKWWDEEAEEESELKWKSLEHNSIVFAPKYEYHGICIKYKGEDMELNSIQEEIATFWAQLLDNDLSKKEITRRNFIKEFKKELKLEKCELEDFDFTPIYDYLQKTKEKNKTKTIEEKKVYIIKLG